jgi:hypothetical protein
MSAKSAGHKGKKLMRKKEAKAFFELYSKDVQKLAWQVRELIFEIAPDLAETVYPQMKVIRYGLDGNKMNALVCAIMPTKAGVSLGFMHGTALSDPKGLLEGTGKNLRHVKLKTPEDAASPALSQLVEQAIADKRKRLGKA